MAASDSNRLGDLLPWWLLTPSCNNPTSPLPQEGDFAQGALENMGGPLPWGCEQADQGPQDQA